MAKKKTKKSVLQTDDHVSMTSPQTGRKKLIKCAHIRGLAKRGRLSMFPWQFSSKKDADLYDQWLKAKREAEENRSKGMAKPKIYAVSNKKAADESAGEAKPEAEKEKAKEDDKPRPASGDAKGYEIKDALNN